MINLDAIIRQYPEHLQKFNRHILREYLQYKILDYVFESKYGKSLAFMGGTALRIVYGNTRFSEDLDFDNLGLSFEEFDLLGRELQRHMAENGFETEIRSIEKGAYHLNIKFPKLLFDQNMSGYESEKILIQIDTTPQNFPFEPEWKLLQKFEVAARIQVTPVDILYAQKLYAAFNRKRLKGRDFFDLMFLSGFGYKPNYAYLKKNLQLESKEELISYLQKQSAEVDFAKLANDVAPFLFNPEDKKKVTLFPEFISQLSL